MRCATRSRTWLTAVQPRRKRFRPLPPRVAPRHAGAAPNQKPLIRATDHGRGTTLDAEVFAPARRGGGWGGFADSFIRLNEKALTRLDVSAEISSSDSGVRLSLVPGSRTGAIPLRSAQTGQVSAGFLVEPRFGWGGVGRVLTQTGWQTQPDFLDGPLVPGSGREVPSWVLAGPVLARLADLLRALRRGYRIEEETLRHPRGQIVWTKYVRESLIRGKWDRLPCRFPDLANDPKLRRMIRWGVERVRQALASVSGADAIARQLITVADEVLTQLRDVIPLMPARDELMRLADNRVADILLRNGLEALGWVVDERGLGGGREMDGLAWSIRLDELWERYVEAAVRREVVMTGGSVRVGRKRETVFPLEWTDPSHRSMGQLIPDIVVFRGSSVHIVDAKYKAHFAELDEHGWHRFTTDVREAHRADIHQVLAYASLYSADEVKATLVYPLRQRTYEVLRARGRDVSAAHLFHGARQVRLELRGMPFGTVSQ
jgi:hypothetical protein